MFDRTTFLKNEIARAQDAAEAFREMAGQPRDVLARVSSDARLQTESFAFRLLNYAHALRGTIDPDALSVYVEAALTALRDGRSDDHDLLCRAWLEEASIRMLRGHFSDAATAITLAAEHAALLMDDAEFYDALIDHSRAALEYYTEHTTAAAARLARVIEAFSRLGDRRRANLANNLMTCIEFRLENHALALANLQTEARTAHARNDEAELARIYSSIATCYLYLKEYERAEEAAVIAARCAQRLGMTLAEASIACTSALIQLCRDGVLTGLNRLEQVRSRCFELGWPGEALICLLNAVELITSIDPTADVLAPLCRSVQVEASRLSLHASVAEATEHLRVNALRKTITPAMVRTVRTMIDPGAHLACEEVCN